MSEGKMWGSLAMSAFSTILNTKGQIEDASNAAKIRRQEGDETLRAAEHRHDIMDYEASQIEDNAVQRYAEGTRELQEGLRQGRVAQSDARAQQAASGGQFNAQSVDQLASLKQATDYNALASLYEAKVDKQSMERQADVRRYDADMGVYSASRQRNQKYKDANNIKTRGRNSALSTVLSGVNEGYNIWRANQD